jgi:hypothetical protein
VVGPGRTMTRPSSIPHDARSLRSPDPATCRATTRIGGGTRVSPKRATQHAPASRTSRAARRTSHVSQGHVRVTGRTATRNPINMWTCFFLAQASASRHPRFDSLSRKKRTRGVEERGDGCRNGHRTNHSSCTSALVSAPTVASEATDTRVVNSCDDAIAARAGRGISAIPS